MGITRDRWIEGVNWLGSRWNTRSWKDPVGEGNGSDEDAAQERPIFERVSEEGVDRIEIGGGRQHDTETEEDHSWQGWQNHSARDYTAWNGKVLIEEEFTINDKRFRRMQDEINKRNESIGLLTESYEAKIRRLEEERAEQVFKNWLTLPENHICWGPKNCRINNEGEVQFWTVLWWERRRRGLGNERAA